MKGTHEEEGVNMMHEVSSSLHPPRGPRVEYLEDPLQIAPYRCMKVKVYERISDSPRGGGD